MKFEIQTISIKDLIELDNAGKLDLSPPYQRNEIWSTNSKKLLIDSILKNYPLPNFFVRLKNKSQWEMVDGQQRSRAIIQFFDKKFPTNEKLFYDDINFPTFIKYKLAIVFISDLKEGETIEDFYVRVNSTGMKLNRPELKKAEYFDTKLMNLLNELAVDNTFIKLDLFTDSALNRMNDIDFVSELVALIKYGITDKKDFVDKLFQDDISNSDYELLRTKFLDTIKIFKEFNEVYPLKKTRYRQRNDFYTLFGFINSIPNTKIEIFKYFYSLLTLIGEDISPSNEDCEPLLNYAISCVSQSNSKQARQNRLNFLNELFLNKSPKPNDTQNQIISYYELRREDFVNIGGYLVIDIKSLQKVVVTPKIEFTFK